MVIQFLKDRLSKTRVFLHEKLGGFINQHALDKETLEELEAILIQADLGVSTSDLIIHELKKRIVRECEKEEIYSAVRDVLLNILKEGTQDIGLKKNLDGPSVVLILGVNGTGKTTSIAKLAYKLKTDGKKVLFAAGDTFRAAAIEQLEEWGNRVGVQVIKHTYKAEPSAVSYDALMAAVSRNVDYLFIDTAGRFHNKEELVEELRKIDRTLNKYCPGAPHEKLLVIDANTGQNGLVQARQFNEAIKLTGIIITKLDGTAKGGILINIKKELNIPIKYIGIGQELTDLQEFDPASYVEAII